MSRCCDRAEGSAGQAGGICGGRAGGIWEEVSRCCGRKSKESAGRPAGFKEGEPLLWWEAEEGSRRASRRDSLAESAGEEARRRDLLSQTRARRFGGAGGSPFRQSALSGPEQPLPSRSPMAMVPLSTSYG